MSVYSNKWYTIIAILAITASIVVPIGNAVKPTQTQILGKYLDNWGNRPNLTEFQSGGQTILKNCLDSTCLDATYTESTGIFYCNNNWALATDWTGSQSDVHLHWYHGALFDMGAIWVWQSA